MQDREFGEFLYKRDAPFTEAETSWECGALGFVGLTKMCIAICLRYKRSKD